MKSLLRLLYSRRLGLLLLAFLTLLLVLARPTQAQQVFARQFGPAYLVQVNVGVDKPAKCAGAKNTFPSTW